MRTSRAILALSAAVALTAARIAAAAPAGASAPPGGDVSDLPLHEVPSRTDGRRFAFLITGDGGWVGADKVLAATLAEGGVPVVALDARRYFWKRKTPEQTVGDTVRALDHYRAAWGRDEVVLVGYSRGADIVPLILARMPRAERAHVVLAALVGPAVFGELEVHVVDLFSRRRRAGAFDVEAELRAAGGDVPILCFEGEDEHDTVCPKLAALPWVTEGHHAGGHRLKDGGAKDVGRDILAALPAR